MRSLRMFLPLMALVLFFAVLTANAQDPASSVETPCAGTTAVSVASRPTVANATDPTQCGVLELEYGLERQWPGAGANRDDLSGGLRLGLTHNLDFHWFSSAFIHLMSGTANLTGYGDNWLGLKYRVMKQTRKRPSFGLYYAAKVPSASAKLGLGSGQVDHSISFLASKDVPHVHFDFNVIELLAGRQTASGFDHNTGFALASWVPVTHRLTLVLEPYGYTLLNQTSPAFASTMGGFNYQMRPRLYFDSGLDFGVTAAAPTKRVFVGVTYALGNLYSWMRPEK
jgi:Putative MetA-pathway of phenol degradation